MSESNFRKAQPIGGQYKVTAPRRCLLFQTRIRILACETSRARVVRLPDRLCTVSKPCAEQSYCESILRTLRSPRYVCAKSANASAVADVHGDFLKLGHPVLGRIEQAPVRDGSFAHVSFHIPVPPENSVRVGLAM
jgi:hypothetical protein